MSNTRRLPQIDPPVTHAMFGDDGILPCCGVHRYEALQTDRVAVPMTPPLPVTCDGTKRIGGQSKN